jgi:RNA polymerase sigma factor for flagellar operon FliA
MGIEMLDLEVANPLDARNRLVMRELDQVRYIAAKIREGLPRSISIEDLVSAGVLGSVEATETYDRTKPTKFKTFARFRIQGAIIDSMRQVDWAPRLLRKQGREIDQTICQLELAMGRTPDESEIAEGVGKPLAELQKTLRELDSLGIAGPQSSSTFNSAETVDLIESAPSRVDDDPFHLLAECEMKEHLAASICKLTKREQFIIYLHYTEELTMKEVGARLGVSQSRVSQMHRAGLTRLRTSLKHLKGCLQ